MLFLSEYENRLNLLNKERVEVLIVQSSLSGGWLLRPPGRAHWQIPYPHRYL
jgi:hypothetical protein